MKYYLNTRGEKMQRILYRALLVALAFMYVLPVGMAYSNDPDLAGEITFTLVDASIDQDLSTLVDEATINLAKTGQKLNVRADIGVPVDHVQFEVDGTDFRTEKKSPYALAGDEAGDYIAWTPEVGHYTLQATAYDAAENEVASKIIYFTVVDNATDANQFIKSASAKEIVVRPSAATDWKKSVYFGDTNYIKFELPQGRGLKNLESFELDLDVNKTAYCIMEINAHKMVNRPKVIQYAGNTKISFESFNKPLSFFHDSFTNSISFKFQIKSNTPIAGSFAEITDATLKLVYEDEDPQPSPTPTPNPSPAPNPTPSPSPSCVEVEGKCWYYGGVNQTCREVCASHGGYDEATRTFAGSGIDGMNNSIRALIELNDNCVKVMDALGIVPSSLLNTKVYGSGCFTRTDYHSGALLRIRDNTTRTDQDAPFFVHSHFPNSRNERRICACQN